MRGLLVSSTVALLASCTALPPPGEWLVRPDSAQPASRRERRDTERADDIGPLDMQRVLALALERNPGLEAVRRRVERAEAVLDGARAAFYPTVGARGSWVRFFEAADFRGRSGDDVGDASTRTRFFTGAGSDIYSAGVDVRYPIFDGGRAYHEREAATAELAAMEADATRARDALELLVAETLIDLLLARGGVEIAEESLAFSEAEHRYAGSRLAAGSALDTDVLQFATSASEARAVVLQIRSRARVLLAALSELVDIDLPEDVEFIVPTETLEVTEGDWVDVARVQRPELRMLAERRRAALHELRKEAAAWWPELDVFGSYGVLSLDSLEIGSAQDELTAGAALSWNLFEGGATSARIAERRAELLEVEALDRELTRRIEREVRQARAEFDVAQENLAVSAETERLASQLLEKTRERYRLEEALVLDVTEAELRYTTARSAHATARAEVLRASARARRALGVR